MTPEGAITSAAGARRGIFGWITLKVLSDFFIFSSYLTEKYGAG
jgi:hypothetical protein